MERNRIVVRERKKRESQTRQPYDRPIYSFQHIRYSRAGEPATCLS